MELGWLIIAIVVLALVFDFTNGFHDAANAIAAAVGGIAGAGSQVEGTHVDQRVVRHMIVAWIMTLPAAAALAAAAYLLLSVR